MIIPGFEGRPLQSNSGEWHESRRQLEPIPLSLDPVIILRTEFRKKTVNAAAVNWKEKKKSLTTALSSEKQLVQPWMSGKQGTAHSFGMNTGTSG